MLRDNRAVRTVQLKLRCVAASLLMIMYRSPSTAVKLRRRSEVAGTVSFLLWARWLWWNLHTIVCKCVKTHLILTHPAFRLIRSEVGQTVRSGV